MAVSIVSRRRQSRRKRVGTDAGCGLRVPGGTARWGLVQRFNRHGISPAEPYFFWVRFAGFNSSSGGSAPMASEICRLALRREAMISWMPMVSSMRLT